MTRLVNESCDRTTAAPVTVLGLLRVYLRLLRIGFATAITLWFAARRSNKNIIIVWNSGSRAGSAAHFTAILRPKPTNGIARAMPAAPWSKEQATR